jgi:hypothetical protein
MNATGAYKGEELRVTFTADISDEDVGGELPVMQSFVDDIEVDTVTILDVTLTPEEYAALPSRLRARIFSLADQVEFE